MKRFFKIFFVPEFYGVLFLIAGALLFFSSRITIENILYKDSKTEKETSFPFSEAIQDHDFFTIQFDIKANGNDSYYLKVIPDDCAEYFILNGKKVSLNYEEERCNYSKGFILYSGLIQKYATNRTDHFEISLKNKGGPGGLNIIVMNPVSFFHVFLFLGTILLVFGIFRRIKINRFFTCILILGVSLRILFFAILPYTAFAHDVEGHIQYISYIVEHKSIPASDACWTCYHPPVYYTFSAIPFALGDFFNISSTTFVQLFSLCLSILFLVLGFKIFQLFLTQKKLFFATILLCFWPLLLFVAPRIGNDQLFYVFHSICLFGVLNYISKKSTRSLVIAAFACIFSYFTKSSGFVTLAIFTLGFILGYFPRESLRPKKAEVISLVIFGFLVLSILSLKIFGESALIGNASGLHSKLIVPNHFWNYVYFDLKTFITKPFTSPWEDSLGRIFFWNYTLKTSLFGEFKILESALGKNLASLLSCNLLLMLVAFVYGLWKSKLSRIDFILLSQMVLFLFALMYLRMTLPYACSNDFRYILPLLLSFIPFVVRGSFSETASLKWKILHGTNLLVFTIISVLFAKEVLLNLL